MMILVTACGGEESTGTSSPSTSVDPGESASTTVETTTAITAEPDKTKVSTAADSTASTSTDPQGGDDIVITFSVEGGFAGLSRSLEIGADGLATVDSNGAVSMGQVDPAELDRLVEALETSGLFDEDATFEAEGADLQRYEIHFADTTVVALDTAIPDALTEPIDALSQVMNALVTG